ncbi:hypothetical protein [Microbulbifer sp. DLAB2-AA]|uniref:hypothetical protein n=1 Tax=Microbulbifer sp. DLAB2-AA TaxID=3243394 RepID=UPI00403A1DFD
MANGEGYLRGVVTACNVLGYKVGVLGVTAPAGSGYYYRVKCMNLCGRVEEVLLANDLTTTIHKITASAVCLAEINPGVGQV